MTLAATSILVAAMPATAGDLVRTDGNDTPGPLDLASMRLTPKSSFDRFQVRTLARFTAKQLDGDDGWVEVDFDTNADKDVDYWVVIFYHNANLLAVQGHGSNALRRLPVHRVDKRTVSFDITHGQLGGVKSYDFYAVSVWRASPCSHKTPCVDTIPNRYPLVRYDFTAPTVRWKRLPNTSTEVSDQLTFPIGFVVKDDRFGSGIKSWKFQLSDNGLDWVTIKTGSSRSPTVNINGVSGHRYGYRVIVVDRAGNDTTSRAQTQTAVPYDDRDAALVFSSSTQVSRSGAFLGTLTSLPQTETMTYTATFAGKNYEHFCVLLGHPATASSTATATLRWDGNLITSVSENDSTADRNLGLCMNPGSGSHTLVVTTTSAEPFIIDGVLAIG